MEQQLHQMGGLMEGQESDYVWATLIPQHQQQAALMRQHLELAQHQSINPVSVTIFAVPLPPRAEFVA